MGDRPALKSEAEGTKIEITPEMIEAGMKLVGTEDFIKQDIEEIWNTMCAEALK